MNMYIDFSGKKLWLEGDKAYDIGKLTSQLSSLQAEQKSLINNIASNKDKISTLSANNLVSEVRLNEVNELINKISGILSRMDSSNK